MNTISNPIQTPESLTSLPLLDNFVNLAYGKPYDPRLWTCLGLFPIQLFKVIRKLTSSSKNSHNITFFRILSGVEYLIILIKAGVTELGLKNIFSRHSSTSTADQFIFVVMYRASCVIHNRIQSCNTTTAKGMTAIQTKLFIVYR